MLLRNYDNIMTARKIGAREKGTATVFGDGYLTAKDLLGRLYNVYAISQGGGWNLLPLTRFLYSYAIDSTDGNSGFSNLICGSGDTPVTYDDYKLASPFTSEQVTKIGDVTSVIETLTYNENDDTWTHTATKTYIANEGITIKEIGATSGVYYDDTHRSSALVYRKVLDTPIEVPAGATFKLSFTATLSANPNKPANYDATASV